MNKANWQVEDNHVSFNGNQGGLLQLLLSMSCEIGGRVTTGKMSVNHVKTGTVFVGLCENDGEYRVQLAAFLEGATFDVAKVRALVTKPTSIQLTRLKATGANSVFMATLDRSTIDALPVFTSGFGEVCGMVLLGELAAGNYLRNAELQATGITSWKMEKGNILHSKTDVLKG